MVPAPFATMEGDPLVGIITERDHARGTADRLSPGVTPVSNCMTTELVTVGPEDEAQAAAADDEPAVRIRHLPVMSESESADFSQRAVLWGPLRAAASWGTWPTSRG
jgi:CBS domain-containing protein